MVHISDIQYFCLTFLITVCNTTFRFFIVVSMSLFLISLIFIIQSHTLTIMDKTLDVSGKTLRCLVISSFHLVKEFL